MIEAFFVAFVIFVAYVIYIIVIQPNRAAARAASLKPKSQPKTATKSKAAKPAAKITEKPVAKAPAKKSSPAPAASAETTAEAVTVLRNPKTDETASVPNNYRFAKRWIKDALVEEGLLDKVYKNNELDDAASKKVKDAVNKLKTLKKYQG